MSPPLKSPAPSARAIWPALIGAVDDAKGRLLRLNIVRGSVGHAFAISIIPTAMALVLQLGTFVLMGRALGAAQFGELSACLALAAVFVEVVGLGSADILVRGVVTQPDRFADYFGNTLCLTALSLPPAVAVAGFIALKGFGLAIAPLALIAILASEILNSRISATVENICVAHRDVAYGSYVRLTTASARFALAAGALGLFHVHSLQTWIWCCVVQSCITATGFIVMAAWLYGRPRAHLAVPEFGVGLLFATNQTARAAQGNLDRAFMLSVSTGELLGSYAAASRIIQLALFPVQIANRILYPRFFAKGAEGGIAATRRFALACAPILFGLGAVCGVAVAVAALGAPMVLGPGFRSATPICIGLALALPLVAIQYPPADALTGSGRQGARTLIFTVLSIAFSFGLAMGARFGGLNGLVGAFVGGQAVIAACLWALVFWVRDQPAATGDG